MDKLKKFIRNLQALLQLFCQVREKTSYSEKILHKDEVLDTEAFLIWIIYVELENLQGVLVSNNYNIWN